VAEIDVAVIGGGPAGLSAAIAARRAGAERVVVFERAEALGGVLHQCVHNGFGLHYFGEDLTGPEYAHRLIQEAQAAGVECLRETMVLSLGADRRMTAANRRGLLRSRPGAVILAMGCRERTAGAIGIPGMRPAGVLTAGVAQRLVNVEGYLPGNEVVILGSGDIGMIMARRLTLEGARVKAVLEILPYPNGLVRNEVQCLRDFGIPLLLSHTVTFVHGRDRVTGVTYSRVDDRLCPISGSEQHLACDTLLLSVGLIPENELSRIAGVELDPVTGGAIVGEDRTTTAPGVFACGNVLHVHDLVDNASVEAEIAGTHAAAFARGRAAPARRALRLTPGRNVRYVVPHHVDPEAGGPLTLCLRVSRPFEGAVLRYGARSKRIRYCRPSEMITLQVSRRDREVWAQESEVVIDCEPA
jgi:NADPH-dependent 2,4-dienoyl-CoA reductase/sulfur reductase-like enzyme